MTDNRHTRKALVFHIMYGSYADITPAETAIWRRWAARYINGGDICPLSVPAFRAALAADYEKVCAAVQGESAAYEAGYREAVSDILEWMRKGGTVVVGHADGFAAQIEAAFPTAGK